MEALEKKEGFNRLFAFYEPLLSERQVTYFKHYYHDDYSLAEIAALYNVSRNAVHDQLKTCESHLLDYENKLGLLKLYEQRVTLIDTIKETKDLTLLDDLRKLDD